MITAQDVNQLRQQTGAGMMDCKKALMEAEGNFELAIKILRKKGQELYNARASRATSEGAVWTKISSQANYGVMVAISCETDFVAKNEAFQQLGEVVCNAAFTHRPATIEALLRLEMDSIPLQEMVTELVGKVGEKITISHYTALSSDTVASYVHLGNKLGVLVGLEGKPSPQTIEAAQNIAMQVAAMNPLAVDEKRLDTTIIDQELALAKEQARHAGKPEAILDKLAQAKLNKFLKESTLLNQSYVKDHSISVAQYLDSVAPGLTVADFKRVSVE